MSREGRIKLRRTIKGIGATMVIAQLFGFVKSEIAVQLGMMNLESMTLRYLIYGSSAIITVLVASVNYFIARKASP